MKPFLIDHNLPPQLASRLTDIYPGSVHVSAIGLDRTSDRGIWEYASQQDYTIVTKDADFSELALMWGFPPKIIWIRRGNCSNNALEQLLRSQYEAIAAFSEDRNLGILTLF